MVPKFFAYFVLFFTVFSVISTVESSDNCKIFFANGTEYLADDFSNEDKNDTYRGELIVLKLENIKDYAVNANNNFFIYDLTTTELAIRTNDTTWDTFQETYFQESRAFLLKQVAFQFTCADNTERKLNFIQSIYDINTHPPGFLKPKYEFKLPMPWPVMDITMYGGEISVKDIDFTNSKVTFDIKENDFVRIEYGKTDDHKTHTARLIPKKPLDFANELNLEIFAKDEPDIYNIQLKSSSVITITRDPDLSTFVTPKFQKPLSEGKYFPNNNTLNLEDIIITENTYSKDVKAALISKEYEDYFSLTQNENVCQLKIRKEIPEEIYKKKAYITLNIAAKDQKADAQFTGETAVIIELNSTPPDEQMDLKFLEPLEISKAITTEFTGILLEKQAIMFPEMSISYSIENDALKSNLSIDKSGTVKVIKPLQQGSYIVGVLASFDDQTSEYKINLVVTHTPKVDFSLKYLKLDENTAQKDLIKLNENDREHGCHFNILNRGPPGADVAWFTINPATKNIDAGPIYRNHSALQGMLITQAQITIEVDCNAEKIHSLNYVNKKLFSPEIYSNNFKRVNNKLTEIGYWDSKDNYHWLYTQDINNNLQHQTINVEIVNTQKPPPVFDDTSPLYIAYPVSELANIIQPSYLYKLNATNAIDIPSSTIKYSLENTPNDSFWIHPESGVIYPTLNSGSVLSKDTKSIKLKATATNVYGSSTLDINISVLTLEYVSIIELQGAVLEDTKEVLTEISDATEWTVKHLSAAVIPKEVNKREEIFVRGILNLISDKTASTNIKIYTYAFDNDHKVLLADTFVKKMKNVVIDNKNWKIEKVQVQPNNTTPPPPDPIVVIEKDSALLTAVIVLSIILVLVIVCFLVLAVRKYSLSNKNDILLETRSNRSMHVPSYDGTQPQRKSNTSIILINDTDNNISNESTDSNTIVQNNSNLTVENTVKPSTPERKKSNVTFSEEVEHFEINDENDKL